MNDLRNKGALSNYEVSKKYEAGIILKGFEVKAILEGKGKLIGSFIKFVKGEPYLTNFELPLYSKTSKKMEYDPSRERKLLLKKTEISALHKQVKEKGLTIIPLRIYQKDKYIKVEIALAKGKKRHDKKRDEIESTQKMDLLRLQKNRY